MHLTDMKILDKNFQHGSAKQLEYATIASFHIFTYLSIYGLFHPSLRSFTQAIRINQNWTCPRTFILTSTNTIKRSGKCSFFCVSLVKDPSSCPGIKYAMSCTFNAHSWAISGKWTAFSMAYI